MLGSFLASLVRVGAETLTCFVHATVLGEATVPNEVMQACSGRAEKLIFGRGGW